MQYEHDVEAELFDDMIILTVEIFEEVTMTKEQAQEQAQEAHRILGHFIATGALPE